MVKIIHRKIYTTGTPTGIDYGGDITRASGIFSNYTIYIEEIAGVIHETYDKIHDIYNSGFSINITDIISDTNPYIVALAIDKDNNVYTETKPTTETAVSEQTDTLILDTTKYLQFAMLYVTGNAIDNIVSMCNGVSGRDVHTAFKQLSLSVGTVNSGVLVSQGKLQLRFNSSGIVQPHSFSYGKNQNRAMKEKRESLKRADKKISENINDTKFFGNIKNAVLINVHKKSNDNSNYFDYKFTPYYYRPTDGNSPTGRVANDKWSLCTVVLSNNDKLGIHWVLHYSDVAYDAWWQAQRAIETKGSNLPLGVKSGDKIAGWVIMRGDSGNIADEDTCRLLSSNRFGTAPINKYKEPTRIRMVLDIRGVAVLDNNKEVTLCQTI